MALIEFRQNRSLVRQLTRIADCLEEFLRVNYGIHMSPPKSDTSGDDPDVLYTDEDRIAMLEALDRAGENTPEEKRAELQKAREALMRGELP